MIKLSLLDKFIVLISLALIAGLFVYTWSPTFDTRYAAVYVNGEKRYIIDLLEDKSFEFSGDKGVSKLEVRKGRVRFLASPCHSQYCVRSRWLSPVVGIIACLPNGVSIELLNQNKQYDGINF